MLIKYKNKRNHEKYYKESFKLFYLFYLLQLMAAYKIQKHNKKEKCLKGSPKKSQRPHTQTDHPAIKKYKITKEKY